MLLKVDSDRDVVDIHKQIVAAECLGEPIVQSTGYGDRIVAAVVDENLASSHCCARRSPEGTPKSYCRIVQRTISFGTWHKRSRGSRLDYISQISLQILRGCLRSQTGREFWPPVN